jgi:methyltransferase
MFLNTAALTLATLTGVFRLCEIGYGEWNAKKLYAEDGQEFAAWQRWPIFILYALWLFALPVFTLLDTQPNYWILTLYVVCEVLRWWAIFHLGKFWTTRIIVVPNGKRITSGPYRFLPHPIYIALFGEVVALSLTFEQWGLACFFGGLVALWIFFRIRAEDMALKLMK